jgi:hypothetical protein
MTTSYTGYRITSVEFATRRAGVREKREERREKREERREKREERREKRERGAVRVCERREKRGRK